MPPKNAPLRTTSNATFWFLGKAWASKTIRKLPLFKVTVHNHPSNSSNFICLKSPTLMYGIWPEYFKKLDILLEFVWLANGIWEKRMRGNSFLFFHILFARQSICSSTIVLYILYTVYIYIKQNQFLCNRWQRSTKDLSQFHLSAKF